MGFFFHSEGMIHLFRGQGLVGCCLLKIKTFKNGNVTGFVSAVHSYERKCMHRKLERMSNKKLMKFELFETVFLKLLFEDNFGYELFRFYNICYMYFNTTLVQKSTVLI